MTSLYEQDFLAWTEQTSQLLKQKCWEDVDWESLIDEVESLGKRQRKAVRSQLNRLLIHLLKWKYQPERICTSWQTSIRSARREIEYELEDSPSLSRYLSEVYLETYLKARLDAADETTLPVDTFPVEPPFSLSGVLSLEYLPD